MWVCECVGVGVGVGECVTIGYISIGYHGVTHKSQGQTQFSFPN